MYIKRQSVLLLLRDLQRLVRFYIRLPMEAFVVLSKSETQDSGYYGSSKTMLLWIMQAYYDFQQQKIEDRTKFFVCLLPISGVKWKWLCILMGPESTRLETIKGFCAYLHFQGTFYIKHVGHYSYRETMYYAT